MATLERIRVTWTGSPVVGPSVSTFYRDVANPATVLAALTSFFTAIAGVLPAGLQIAVQGSGDLIESTDGSLAGSWSGSGGGVVNASGSSGFTMGVGARVVWGTNGVHGGRRVKGSTFLVPISSNNFEGAGAIAASFISTVQAAADTLVNDTDGAMVILSKPSLTESGEFSPVVSALVPDAVSWLRSRRT